MCENEKREVLESDDLDIHVKCLHLILSLVFFMLALLPSTSFL